MTAALVADIAVLASMHRAPGQTAVVAGFTLAVANFISCALLSNAGADPGPYGPLHLAIHAAHMLGVSLSLGGLLPLAMLLSRAKQTGDEKMLAIAHHASVCFGNVALFSVVLILLTGVANTALVVDSAADLIRRLTRRR